MTTTIRGTLGQLAVQSGDVIGVLRREDNNKILFVHIPADVTNHVLHALAPERVVELTGHMCDHEQYLVVTAVKPDEYEQQCEGCSEPFEAAEPTSLCPECEAA